MAAAIHAAPRRREALVSRANRVSARRTSRWVGARARPDAASLAARALTERLSPELRAFLASVEPLAKGPHLAAAMPYGLVLR